MDLIRKYYLSYPDSKKLLEEAVKRSQAMEKVIHEMEFDSRENITRAVNKLVYQVAEQKGISIYDVCLHTVPDFDGVDIKLIPIEFDFKHDGGYWKEKYFKLKKKMQEVIDSKEE